MGDATSGPVRLSFNPQLRVEFRGATVTSDAGLLLPRELDERLGLSALIERHLSDPRTGSNSLYQIYSASPSIAAWRATRTPTTPNGWPKTRRFGCWPPASDGRRASRSPRRSTGSRRKSSLRSGTTKGSRASIRAGAARSDRDPARDPRYRQFRESSARGTRAVRLQRPLRVRLLSPPLHLQPRR